MISFEDLREIKCKIQMNQVELMEAMQKHQKLRTKLRESDVRFSKTIQDLIDDVLEQIEQFGYEQKSLMETYRKEFKTFKRLRLNVNVNLHAIPERRNNIANTVVRTVRKPQQIIVPRAIPLPSRTPQSSPNEDPLSTPPTPEPLIVYPLNPQDIPQTDFLTYFGLATHEVFREIQTRRAERKRRRTANPHIFYSRPRFFSKRKRNEYLASNVSPPNTRAARKRGNSPSPRNSRANSPLEKKSPGQSSAECIKIKEEEPTCAECKLGDNLLSCEMCGQAFHVACHNRPLNQTPRHCPKCMKHVMTHEKIIGEKLRSRALLFEKNKLLCAGLIKMQDRHADLEVSLKTQDAVKRDMLNVQRMMREKIDKIIGFVRTVQSNDFGAVRVKEEIVEEDSTERLMVCEDTMDTPYDPDAVKQENEDVVKEVKEEPVDRDEFCEKYDEEDDSHQMQTMAVAGLSLANCEA